MPSATMTIRLDQSEKKLISDYARTFGVSVSEFMRQSALAHIEDEIDLQAWEKAKAEFDANPISYSVEETKRMLDLA